MSRSAIPCALRAAMVAFMRVRFCAMASAAVGAWTWTPRVMVAWSGAIFVSPKAERLRVVARNTASLSWA